MTNSNTILNDTWLKASVLGATWAASEIILGSFLHNLHIPFKGNFLTAIGLILMIAASYRWNNRGLFWRSGLICALMKTMSPSAVIFGPMIAIFIESLLFEFSVRIFGRNLLGFALGAVLAMSWVLFQKIFNYLLYYGFNIVKIYDNILKFVEKQLNLNTELFWLPLLALLSIYALFGIFTAILGLRIGRQMLHNSSFSKNSNKRQWLDQKKQKSNFPHSLLWLAMSFISLVFTLIIIGQVKWYYWLPWSLVLIIIWIARYKRGMRQLSRPKFWISFIIITVLSAMLINSINGSNGTWLDGLWMGIEMNTRAAIVIVGFSVIGTELFHPKIRNYLSNSSYKQASAALELAFDVLPAVIGQLPDARTFLTRPAEVIRMLINHAEFRLSTLKDSNCPKIFIVYGGIESGKTSFLLELSNLLKFEEKSVAGFISPRVIEDGRTVAYRVVDIKNGHSQLLMHQKEAEIIEPLLKIGKYYVEKRAFDWAESLLHRAISDNIDLVMIDEVGRLELKEEGWFNAINLLMKSNVKVMVLAVRDEFVKDVIGKFKIKNPVLIDIYKTIPEQFIRNEMELDI
ncbi:MAG: hypothetical protein JXR60_03275 [Bacteroidales bacterium]|nr:hypothetical protein [Bacteroidales bacterium]